MDANKQGQALAALNDADEPPATLSSLIGAADPAPPQGALDRLKRSWFATPPDVQQQFLAWLQESDREEPQQN